MDDEKKVGHNRVTIEGNLCTRLTMNRGRKDRSSQPNFLHSCSDLELRADGSVSGRMWLDCLGHRLEVGGWAPRASGCRSPLLGKVLPTT